MLSIRLLAFWAAARFDRETVGDMQSLLVIWCLVKPPPPPGVAEEDPEPVPTLAFLLVGAGDGFFLLLLGPEVLPPPPGVKFALALLPGGAFNDVLTCMKKLQIGDKSPKIKIFISEYKLPLICHEFPIPHSTQMALAAITDGR